MAIFWAYYGNFLCYCANFHVVNGQKIKHNLAIWSHWSEVLERLRLIEWTKPPHREESESAPLSLVTYSVTRFDDILPVCQNFKSICKFLWWCTYLLLWTYFGLKCYWADFHFCEWPNIEQILKPSVHTGDTLKFFLSRSSSLPTYLPIYLLIASFSSLECHDCKVDRCPMYCKTMACHGKALL